MKRKALMRCLIGMPIGLTISTLITIAISLTVGDGRFYPVVPALITDCGSEINAVLLQTVCSLLYGAAWGGATVLWEKEGWSILRQTLTHLAVCSIATFPVAYLMRWMDHSITGVLGYFGIFLGFYALIWLGLYSSLRRRVHQLNAGVKDAIESKRE